MAKLSARLRAEREAELDAARREGVIDAMREVLAKVNELRRDNCGLDEARVWIRGEIERLRAEQKES